MTDDLINEETSFPDVVLHPSIRMKPFGMRYLMFKSNLMFKNFISAYIRAFFGADRRDLQKYVRNIENLIQRKNRYDISGDLFHSWIKRGIIKNQYNKLVYQTADTKIISSIVNLWKSEGTKKYPPKFRVEAQLGGDAMDDFKIIQVNYKRQDFLDFYSKFAPAVEENKNPEHKYIYKFPFIIVPVPLNDCGELYLFNFFDHQQGMMNFDTSIGREAVEHMRDMVKIGLFRERVFHCNKCLLHVYEPLLHMVDFFLLSTALYAKHFQRDANANSDKTTTTLMNHELLIKEIKELEIPSAYNSKKDFSLFPADRYLTIESLGYTFESDTFVNIAGNIFRKFKYMAGSRMGEEF